MMFPGRSLWQKRRSGGRWHHPGSSCHLSQVPNEAKAGHVGAGRSPVLLQDGRRRLAGALHLLQRPCTKSVPAHINYQTQFRNQVKGEVQGGLQLLGKIWMLVSQIPDSGLEILDEPFALLQSLLGVGVAVRPPAALLHFFSTERLAGVLLLDSCCAQVPWLLRVGEISTCECCRVCWPSQQALLGSWWCGSPHNFTLISNF